MVAPTTTDEITLRVQQFYNDTFTKNERRTWIYGWFISGMLTILIPLIIFVTSRRVNTDEEDGGDANNNNNNNNNNEENNQSTSPWWFFGSNSADDRRDEDRTPPILIASYLWSILVFHGILFYGYRAFRYSSSRSSSGQYDTIIVALVLFANYNILSLLLLSNIEGAIETEGPGVDEHGFVGQFGVMMYITSLLWVIFSIIYAMLLHRKGKRQNVIKIEIDQSDYESTTSDYQIHKDEKQPPPVPTTV